MEVGYYGAYMMGYYGCVLKVTMERINGYYGARKMGYYGTFMMGYYHCAWYIGHTSRCQFGVQWTTMI